MNQKLFTVEDCFKIAGRGTVVTCPFEPNFPTLKIGSAIVLAKPDGTQMLTEVGGIEMIQTIRGIKKIAVLVKNVAKEDIPIGTAVYLKS